MIYLAAVVPDKKDPVEHAPYVSVPLGPYRADEVAALARGVEHLKAMYATEDIRRAEPDNQRSDFDTARSMVIRVVGKEHADARYLREQENAKTRLAAYRARGRWTEVDEAQPFRDSAISLTLSVEVDTAGLDRVIHLLGCDPEDV